MTKAYICKQFSLQKNNVSDSQVLRGLFNQISPWMSRLIQSIQIKLMIQTISSGHSKSVRTSSDFIQEKMQGLFKIIEFIHESEMNDFKQSNFRQDTIKK
jgi:hypothetical protein